MGATEQLSAEHVARAAELLNAGHLVAFPTETVYGLGACINLPNAIQDVFRVKGRPSDNPLIAHVSSIAQVEQLAQNIPQTFYQLAEVFFPGPLTIVLERHPDVPAIVSAGLNTIAVRMPSHPIALELIKLVGAPLVAPSANLSGKPSATQSIHVLEDFDGKIAAILDGGKTKIGIESTVISLLGQQPVLLRPGSISQVELEKVLGCSVLTSQPQGPIVSPGLKHRHYCPKIPVRLFDSLDEMQQYLRHQTKRRLLLSRRSIQEDNCDHVLLSAQEFYASLRYADQNNYDEILIYCDEELLEESGLMNRIFRASGAEESAQRKETR